MNTPKPTRLEFNRDRAAALKRIKDYNREHPSLWLVPFALTLLFEAMDERTECVAGKDQATLARLTGCDVRTVQRLRPILQKLGIEIEGGNGRGVTCVYRVTPRDKYKNTAPMLSFGEGKGRHGLAERASS